MLFRSILAIPGMTKELLVEMRGIILEEFEERENPDIRSYILSLDVPPTPLPATASERGVQSTESPISTETLTNGESNGEARQAEALS